MEPSIIKETILNNKVCTAQDRDVNVCIVAGDRTNFFKDRSICKPCYKARLARYNLKNRVKLQEHNKALRLKKKLAKEADKELKKAEALKQLEDKRNDVEQYLKTLSNSHLLQIGKMVEKISFNLFIKN